ncbi:HAD family hydrolase [Jannaschia aquimarina]|uniref:Uncharacterized protein n=1 Tax=Jannaschia aquimarina TaxID=935700 RepID=A0A0D1EIC7_9RHOB|nr:HAD family hydrolase [Jannaschia aquimarina]KIT16671.1 hypothetical protein jaqu_14590 [Jannaschia aquimarina]SNS55567.1 2-haloacid dehalogenase [Jannaschia aquimarina]
MTDETVVVLDVGNVLIEWQPERYYDARIGPVRRRALFAAVDLPEMNLRLDRGEGFRDVIYETADAHPEWRDEIRLWHDDWLALASPAIDRSVRLMRALRAKGIPVHALTNFSDESFELAKRHYEFLDEFDAAHVSGRLGVIKPAPEIYAAVEAATGRPGPAHLFADDRPDNITVAEGRGWRTHLFEGADGWADRLVREGLLTEAEAA